MNPYISRISRSAKSLRWLQYLRTYLPTYLRIPPTVLTTLTSKHAWVFALAELPNNHIIS